MHITFLKVSISALIFNGLLFMQTASFAATTIDFGEDRSISIGIGGITSYRTEEDAESNGTERSHDFKLNSARLLLSGSLNKNIKAMLKTERVVSNGSIDIIDANIQYEINPDLSIWAGRMLSPSDRANMAGPYYSMGGGYWAGVASRYGFNGGIYGRDDGGAIVGKALDKRLTYAIGAFDGDNIFRFSGIGKPLAKDSDNLMYAARLQYNFWDIEPGYYGTANYFGTKDILSIGIAGRSKKDAIAVAGQVGDYQSYSMDFLLEKQNVGAGTASMEAAIYKYDTDNILLGEQGKAWLIGAGYLFNQKIGFGQFMPFIRYQAFAADGTTNVNTVSSAKDVNTKRVELGINYVIKPYNAVISAVYGDTKITNKDDRNVLNIAIQFQY